MGRLLPLLVKETGLGEHDVLRIVSNAPVRYKTYKIKKRNGGDRVISQPARELKALQRIIAEHVLSHQVVHPAATAYRIGMSIRVNAAAHVENGPILKFDFKDFFPSITSLDWRLYCESREVFDDPEDLRISTNVLFHRHGRSSLLRLAIGAPSSPSLSNILMYDFDAKIADLVAKDKVVYTRYADDLTFSAKRTGFLTGVKAALQLAIREIKSPSLTINESKTVLATRKYKRMVTGLILTNDGKVSVGSRRKRQIRAALHHQIHGRLNIAAQARLAGLLAFVSDVEPEFFARLKEKYGGVLIAQLRSVRAPSRIDVRTL
jgi:RNA-directed DNA polymerase